MAPTRRRRSSRRPAARIARVAGRGHRDRAGHSIAAGREAGAGKILIAPSTDPGWTPFFLTAGALVMEMGGLMSHGAVVAREYGIPAVVGLARAAERILTGQRITVDGSAGTVTLVPGRRMDEVARVDDPGRTELLLSGPG